MQNSQGTALIVGAGIGGLAAALALGRAGWTVRVFERARDVRELGFALLLAPNAMHGLRQLGVADAVTAGGCVVEVGELRRPDGTLLRRFDVTAISAALGEPTVAILRPALHGVLKDAVGAAAMELDSEVVSAAADGGGVTLMLADGRTATGAVAIGADGIGSPMRRQLHPTEAAPRASGLFALRGVSFDTIAHLGGLSGAQYFGRGIEAGLGRASPRAVYWYMSIPAVEIATHGRDAHTLMAALSARFHAPFRAIVSATRPEDLRLDELLVRDPIEPWGAGAMTLLGDAAHPMLPHAGQGAAQAIEDAVTLGRALPLGAGIGAGLRRYERVRSARTRTIVAVSRRNARVASMRGVVGCGLRDLIVRWLPQALITRTLISLGRPPQDGFGVPAA